MKNHQEFMRQCFFLAEKGAGNTAPNPLVGCVIVHNGNIIGQGYHRFFGGPHAEVDAITHTGDARLLNESTLYVNLEPCSHHGKTPPCADLIIEKKIPYVVIGCLDPNPLVKGKGIQKLIAAGIDVKVGLLEAEAKFLNRRFFTWVEKKRPHIILKWAQSADGFIDHDREENNNERAIISSPEAHLLVHQWRSEEAAILVGTNTVLTDDPQLTVRLADATGTLMQKKNPVRLTFDRRGRIPMHARILDGTSPTVVFHSGAHYQAAHAEYVPVDFGNDPITQVMNFLYNRELQSVLVEGGAALLNKFLEKNLWDEARVFVSKKNIGKGVKAPAFNKTPVKEEMAGPDKLYFYQNK